LSLQQELRQRHRFTYVESEFGSGCDLDEGEDIKNAKDSENSIRSGRASAVSVEKQVVTWTSDCSSEWSEESEEESERDENKYPSEAESEPAYVNLRQLKKLKKLRKRRDHHSAGSELELVERNLVPNSLVNSVNMENGEREVPLTHGELLDLVKTHIPNFSGEDSVDGNAKLERIIRGCNLIESRLGGIQQTMAVEEVIARLTGNAYEKFKDRNFATLRALAEALKKSFAVRRAISDIRYDIEHATKRRGETLSSFGFRIGQLLAEGVAVLKETWDDAKANVFIEELRLMAIDAFMDKIGDPDVRRECREKGTSDFQKLLDVVDGKRRVGKKVTVKEEPHNESGFSCGFCGLAGHIMEHCPRFKRCSVCRTYGHEEGQCVSSRILAVTEAKCGFCEKSGHEIQECPMRLAKIFCMECDVAGHVTNQFCLQNRGSQNARGADRGRTQFPIDARPHRDSFEGNGRNLRDQTPGRRNNDDVCYGCGRPGHIRAFCPNQPRNGGNPFSGNNRNGNNLNNYRNNNNGHYGGYNRPGNFNNRQSYNNNPNQGGQYERRGGYQNRGPENRGNFYRGNMGNQGNNSMNRDFGRNNERNRSPGNLNRPGQGQQARA